MHALTANITNAVDEDSIRTTNTHKKCLKTTNMADMRDQRTGRERDLSDK